MDIYIDAQVGHNDISTLTFHWQRDQSTATSYLLNPTISTTANHHDAFSAKKLAVSFATDWQRYESLWYKWLTAIIDEKPEISQFYWITPKSIGAQEQNEYWV